MSVEWFGTNEDSLKVKYDMGGGGALVAPPTATTDF